MKENFKIELCQKLETSMRRGPLSRPVKGRRDQGADKNDGGEVSQQSERIFQSAYCKIRRRFRVNIYGEEVIVKAVKWLQRQCGFSHRL